MHIIKNLMKVGCVVESFLLEEIVDKPSRRKKPLLYIKIQLKSNEN